MYTLIEIFDSKQYENIVSAVFSGGISKIIYIGTKHTMTTEKIRNIKSFFSGIGYGASLEFFHVERDNTLCVISMLEEILKKNSNCILDITGGEDVLLVSAGMVAQNHSLPIIRMDSHNGLFSVLHGNTDNLYENKINLKISDLIALQGGKISSGQHISSFSKNDSDDIKSLFLVNSADCESYSIFCNFASAFISVGKNTLSFRENELKSKNEHLKKSITNTLNLLCKHSLLKRISSDSDYVSYRIKSKIISVCLKKSGNLLEYYTALSLLQMPDLFSDVCVGTTVEWNDDNSKSETQNEIDVLAVTNNVPVFISCKNGDVKKEALYELDTVSRNLGGTYAKKILVCSYISGNYSSRSHLIKRARDMGIRLIYDTHKNSYEEFLKYMRNSVK